MSIDPPPPQKRKEKKERKKIVLAVNVLFDLFSRPFIYFFFLDSKIIQQLDEQGLHSSVAWQANINNLS